MKYLSFFRLRFAMGLQYRTAALAGIVTQFVWGFMEIMIFKAFYRADAARSRSQGGYGLGLAIAAAITQGHRGKIDLRSAPGEGTAFIVTLPLSKRGA